MTAFGFLLCIAAMSLGCAETRVSLAQGPREYVASDYPEVLKKWTRERSLLTLTEVDDLLTVTATYESWDFRWAYVVKYAQDYRLTIEQRKVLLDQALRESEENHLFYVALYAGGSTRWTDLTRPTSAWVVRLIDELGNETAPASIEKVPRPGPLERRYFPYTTPFRQVFRIKFPRLASDGKSPTISPTANWLGLRFAGAEGNQELRWALVVPKTGAPTPNASPPPAAPVVAPSPAASQPSAVAPVITTPKPAP
ncbi:MAG: hypothetical protein U0174_22135 [Polyangiaceae bacterium]